MERVARAGWALTVTLLLRLKGYSERCMTTACSVVRFFQSYISFAPLASFAVKVSFAQHCADAESYRHSSPASKSCRTGRDTRPMRGGKRRERILSPCGKPAEDFVRARRNKTKNRAPCGARFFVLRATAP